MLLHPDIRPTIRIDGPMPELRGYRYFWGKRVTGFFPSCHCARCLKGDYLYQSAANMETGVDHILGAVLPGDIVYICGVTRTPGQDENAHLAVEIDPTYHSPFVMDLIRGQRLTMYGAKPLPFTDEAARRRYPDKGPEFLTCRNFQFGAQHFE